MAYTPPDPGQGFPAAMLKVIDEATETGAWYYLAGRVNTSASYTWYGVNTYENAPIFKTNVLFPGGVNNFLNPNDRDAAITTPSAGTIAFIRQDNSGNVLNQLQYYTGATWVALTGSGSTTINETIINPVIQSAKEVSSISATAATGTINYDASSYGILYYTTAASSGFSLNFRWSSTATFNANIAIGQTMTLAFMVKMPATATTTFMSTFTVDGVAPTILWVGGVAPTAGTNGGTDLYTITLIKTADATFTALAQKVGTA